MSTMENRRAFIGGSDARIIMGQDEADLVRLWRIKRGEAEPKDLSEKPGRPARQGDRRAEPAVVRALYGPDDHGLSVNLLQGELQAAFVKFADSEVMRRAFARDGG